MPLPGSTMVWLLWLDHTIKAAMPPVRSHWSRYSSISLVQTSFQIAPPLALTLGSGKVNLQASACESVLSCWATKHYSPRRLKGEL
ncbi:unnamed protein product [Gadus morhua 'NCC']